MDDWSEIAIEIVERFDAYIIPLISKSQPLAKLNLDKWRDSDLPPEKLPSKDPGIIKHWAQRATAYGVVPSDKFLILDVDVKKEQNGRASLKFLSKAGLPTKTFAVRTPTGGLHLYFQHPDHYKPAQSVGTNVRFDDEDVQSKWDDLQAAFDGTTGIDTRYGWGYAVGPGSKFDDMEYSLVDSSDLARIPSDLYLGYLGGVTSRRPTIETAKDILEDISDGSIKAGSRNEHARDVTFKLSLQRLPDSIAHDQIIKLQAKYDDSDGEAPTVDELWDMYERAKEKVGDLVGDLLGRYIFVTTGNKVLDTFTGLVFRLEEFKASYTGQLVPVEINGNIKMKNPVEVWQGSKDRIVVHDIIFNIALDHGVVAVSKQKGSALFYNTFIPPRIIDYTDVTESEMGREIGEACIKVVENVVTSSYDRGWFRKWVGQMLFDHANRPAWHWHIFSAARGIGKDTLGNIISTLYGDDNVAKFGMEVFKDKSNTEFFNCGLGIMSDFEPVSGQGGRSAILSQFKALTGTNVGRMRAMYQDGQQRAVSLRFLLLSNSYNDFPVDKDDRRIFKCESHGISLDSRIYALTHCFTDPNGVTEEMRDAYNLYFLDSDIEYARALLLDYFRTSGYEEMSSQFDCPQNDIKEENTATTEPKYFTDIRGAIRHKVFVFASDIVTRDTLHIFLKSINIGTGADTVLRDLQDAGILRKMYRAASNGKKRQVNTRLGYMKYDDDLLMIRSIGEEVPTTLFACRNFDHWCHLTAKRRPKEELMKIIDYPNIKDGWNAKTAEMMKANKVVPIDGS